MTFSLHQQKAWLAGLLVALLVIAVTPTLTRSLHHSLESGTRQLQAKRDKLARQLAQWEEDAAAAQELSQSIGADEIETFLAPGSRTALAAQLEPLGAAARLVKVTYSLSPAQPWLGNDAFPNIQNVTQSVLTLSADAPHDGDILDFLDSLAERQSGRFELQHLALRRMQAPGSSAALGALNLHAEMKLLWLTNAPAEKGHRK